MNNRGTSSVAYASYATASQREALKYGKRNCVAKELRVREALNLRNVISRKRIRRRRGERFSFCACPTSIHMLCKKSPRVRE